MMRTIFFGSGKIAVASLETLIKRGFEVVCVVTAPDQRKGRNLLFVPTAVKEYALKKKLRIFQPANLSNKETQDYIAKLNPDIFVVFSYGKILPKSLLDTPKLMPLNIHASILPRYRGAAPINWAIIKGEKKTGITIIKMSEKMDEGEIILSREIGIEENDTYLTLEDKLSSLGAQLILESLNKLKNNDIKCKAQDESLASYAPKLKKEDGKIDWNKDAAQINNQIRGCLPWPGSFSYYNGKMIKIWRAEVFSADLEKKFSPGEIISFSKEGILVAAKDKALWIKELQLASGKKLDAWQFAQGHKIEKGRILTLSAYI